MSVIKTILQAGILGTLAYYIIGFIMTSLISATDNVTMFFRTLVPISVAFSIVWLMISQAFKSGD